MVVFTESKGDGMQILQTYLAGKVSPELCEDFLSVNDDFVTVVDGATDKTGHRIEGQTGGRFIAAAIAALMEDRSAVPAYTDFTGWVAALTEGAASALARAGWPDGIPVPCASVVTYSRARRQVWRVGDCGFRLNGVDHVGDKEIDRITGGKRAEITRALLSAGRTVEELLEEDPGREAIMDILRGQYVHANNAESELCFPIVNGRPIPLGHLEFPVEVPDRSLLVLCSDGFDFPADTLAETLDAQAKSYLADPLRIGLDEAKPSPKALRTGMARHDDQAYVLIRT